MDDVVWPDEAIQDTVIEIAERAQDVIEDLRAALGELPDWLADRNRPGVDQLRQEIRYVIRSVAFDGEI